MAYIRSGERTRSANRPPTTAPMAIPPKKPVRMAATAWVVLPKTSTSWRDHTISYTRPAAPLSTKMARIARRRGAAGSPVPIVSVKVGTPRTP